eukprot:3893477-Pyramimonas_sp.AAC.1
MAVYAIINLLPKMMFASKADIGISKGRDLTAKRAERAQQPQQHGSLVIAPCAAAGFQQDE